MPLSLLGFSASMTAQRIIDALADVGLLGGGTDGLPNGRVSGTQNTFTSR
jgi:hypothetical protein